MEEREAKIRGEVIDANVGSLWDILGRYARGTPRLIMYLDRQEGPVKVGDLAQAFDVSMPRVSTMIHRLEFERLVHRTKRRIDYRSTYIELTAKGKARAAELTKRSQENIHKIIEKVGIETVERFLLDARTLSIAAEEVLKEDAPCSD